MYCIHYLFMLPTPPSLAHITFTPYGTSCNGASNYRHDYLSFLCPHSRVSSTTVCMRTEDHEMQVGAPAPDWLTRVLARTPDILRARKEERQSERASKVASLRPGGGLSVLEIKLLPRFY